ncbi:MAG TPA: hypothetical protein VGN72_22370 [Tepidisphaeraceae bacterium]|jgi:hypothetical protein|nr:hypothetical protein [Tepidisphaeraceae bacterium]
MRRFSASIDTITTSIHWPGANVVSAAAAAQLPHDNSERGTIAWYAVSSSMNTSLATPIVRTHPHAGGGVLREDRLVFPVPPAVHWRDVLPVVLQDENGQVASAAQLAARPERRAKAPKPKPVLRAPLMKGGLWFEEEGIIDEPATELAKARKKPKAKIDPRLTAMARELRDRWSERQDLILAPPAAAHDVRRFVSHEAATTVPPRALAGPAVNALPESTALPTAA